MPGGREPGAETEDLSLEVGDLRRRTVGPSQILAGELRVHVAHDQRYGSTGGLGREKREITEIGEVDARIASCMRPTRSSESASVAPSRRLDEFREGVIAGRHVAAVGNDNNRFRAFAAVAISAPCRSSGAPYRQIL